MTRDYYHVLLVGGSGKGKTFSEKLYRDPEKAVTPFMLLPAQWLFGKKALQKPLHKLSLGAAKIDEEVPRLFLGNTKGRKPKGFVKSLFYFLSVKCKLKIVYIQTSKELYKKAIILSI